MNDFLSSEQIARRTRAAVDAAVGAARELGLTVTDAAVLHELFSVVVHLAPAPVVARLPVVLPVDTDPDDLARRQQAELDVAQWLVDRGTPVIPPSTLVPRSPVRRDGFSMTFWRFVEEVRDREPDYVAHAGLVPELHAALQTYPGNLPFLSAADPDSIAADLVRLRGCPDLVAPGELDRARREWQVLEPLVRSRPAFERAFPGIEVRPIHGDSPPANVFAGIDGPLFSDFELVTLGPVEWDLAGIGPEHRAAYDRGAQRIGLRPLDEDVLRFVEAVGMLRVVTVLTLVPQLPVLLDYATPAIEAWRSMPPVGTVGRVAPGRPSP